MKLTAKAAGLAATIALMLVTAAAQANLIYNFTGTECLDEDCRQTQAVTGTLELLDNELIDTNFVKFSFSSPGLSFAFDKEALNEIGVGVFPDLPSAANVHLIFLLTGGVTYAFDSHDDGTWSAELNDPEVDVQFGPSPNAFTSIGGIDGVWNGDAAVPEPGTIALLALALIALAFSRRRKLVRAR